MENLDLVHQKSSNSKPDTFQAGLSGGLPSNMQQVALASNRPICHEVQHSGCTKSAMVGSGYIYLPTSSHLGQSGGEVIGFPMQKNNSDCSGWPNMPWFWDLVTMSSQIPLSLPFLPNLLTQPFNQIPHRNLTT